MSCGYSEASGAGEVGWTGGEEELSSWLAPASVSRGLTAPFWAGALGSRKAEAKRKSPNRGYQRRGRVGQGLGSEPLGVRAETAPLDDPGGTW